MANVIGIDLGTTYSVVARLDATGRAEVLRDNEGNNLTPSCVLFEGESRGIVGWEAKKEGYSKPDLVATAFKREMGSDKNFAPHRMTPTELSSLVLKKLRQICETSVGTVDTAVVTVPANFPNSARVATKTAAELANLPIGNIVNEPTAAALYYALTENISGTIAVYDFGGGTFDVSIVSVAGNDVDVLASQGNQRLGGTDFDACLLQLIGEKYKRQTNSSYEITPVDLLEPLEDLKKSLSTRESKVVSVAPASQPRENISITRPEFEAKIGTLITKAEMLFEAALGEAELSASDLDHVVLVGGSTRVPAVRASVEKLTGRIPLASKNVDEVVALGAAVYAGLRAGNVNLTEAQRSAISTLTLNEVCNHYYGTIVLAHDSEKETHVDQISILIEKNTPIPVSTTESYYTVADGQQYVNCTVTQSSIAETDPRWVNKVSETSLGPLPPGRPAGREIKVTFSYDSDQIMHCRFTDVESGVSNAVKIDLRDESESGSAVDIDQFLVE